MTLQEAHARLSAITAAIHPGLSSGEVLRLQNDLLELVEDLPATVEFDATSEALGAIAGQLNGLLPLAVFDELRSRTAILGAAVSILDKVSNEAAADARTLRLEQPQFVAAGLRNGLALAQQLRQAAKLGDLDAVTQNSEALLAVLTALRDKVKIG